MSTIALYLRASKEDAALGESATIQNQRDLLYHYLKSKPEFTGWNKAEFKDDGCSGTTLERPGVQKMLLMAGTEIQCIIVKDFSRFSRNLLEVGNYLDGVFPFLGVRFIAVNEHYDSNENKGRTIALDIALKSMVYEMYSRDLSKKISSVKEAQMKQGQYIGRIAFYGYKKSDKEKHKLVVDEEAAQVVRRVFTLAAAGMEPTRIAVRFNGEGILPPLRYRQKKYPEIPFYGRQGTEHSVWTKENIKAILKDERYTGCFIGRKKKRLDISGKQVQCLPKEEWIRVNDAFAAIITQEIYQKAQTAFRLTGNRQYQRSSVELFSGMLRCTACGRTLTKMSSKNPYFYCLTKRYAPASSCAAIRVDKAELEQSVLLSLQGWIQLILRMENTGQDDVSSKGAIRKKLRYLQLKEEKCKLDKLFLFEQFFAKRLNRQAFAEGRQALAGRAEALADEKTALIKQLQAAAQMGTGRLEKNLGKYDFAGTLTRTLLKEFVQVIHVFADNRLEIVWTFSDLIMKDTASQECVRRFHQ